MKKNLSAKELYVIISFTMSMIRENKNISMDMLNIDNACLRNIVGSSLLEFKNDIYLNGHYIIIHFRCHEDFKYMINSSIDNTDINYIWTHTIDDMWHIFIRVY